MSIFGRLFGKKDGGSKRGGKEAQDGKGEEESLHGVEIEGMEGLLLKTGLFTVEPIVAFQKSADRPAHAYVSIPGRSPITRTPHTNQ